MDFTGPKIIKRNGGLEKDAPSDRNVGGMIIAGGYELPGTFEFGKSYLFNTLAEAEAAGLGPDTDANASDVSSALTWYQISEYFYVNPDGKLFVHNGEALTAESVFNPGGVADQLLNFSSKALRYMGVVIGGDPAASITVTNGMQSTVWEMQAAAQAWVDDKAKEFIYIDSVVIEGKALTSSPVTFNLHSLASDQVAITVANDLGYLAPYMADLAAFAKTAAVGTALGAIGVRQLCESVGSPDIERKPLAKRGQPNYTLANPLRGRWLKPGVSSGVAFDNLSQAHKTALGKFGYLFVGRYEGYDCVCFNDSQTCGLETSDFSVIENNRVWNEAARISRRTLIPLMNSTVDIDEATGYIRATTIARWTALVNRAIEKELLVDGQISAFKFTINPAQNVLGGNPVVTRLSVTPRGIARAIEHEIGFDNPFKR